MIQGYSSTGNISSKNISEAYMSLPSNRVIEGQVISKDGKNLRIEDKNGTQYQAYTHELSENDKKIPAGYTQTVTIKYYSRYSSNKIIKYTAFERIVLDYGAYSHYTNIGAYKNFGSIRIEIPQN